MENKIFYIEQGEKTKPILVLLHGLGMAHRMWQPQLAELSKHFHLFVPDLPGIAQSASDGPFTMQKIASLILDFIREKKEGNQKIHVCGLSLGAMVTLEMAIQSKRELSSIILSGGQVKPPKMTMLIQRLIFSLMPKKTIVEQMPNSIPTQDTEIRKAAEEDAKMTKKSGFLKILKAVSNVNFRDQLAKVQIPTLVLCGGNDEPNIPAAEELAKKIPNAQLKVIPDHGHVWNIENPELFNQTVVDFLLEK
jgi:3-oxoadipate enol-lactonase